jgi:undecaprenyl-diphosphatase
MGADMTPVQAITIAVVQGATELFPVSSLGHAVLIPWLLGWKFDAEGATFLPFLVMLHVGTACALLVYFRRDWGFLLPGVFGIGSAAQTTQSRRLALLIVLATIPAVIVGGAFEHTLRRLFVSPLFAAGFLLANGLLLLAGEALQRGRTAQLTRRPEDVLSPRDALVIGCWQCLALLPGLSRSGATMVGGLLRGVDHEKSAHFSFLIAFPVIAAATVLEVPKLLHAPAPSQVMALAAASSVIAGLVAYASLAFLMRYFRTGGQQTLKPFAYYCLVAGGASLIYGAVHAS